MRLSASCAVQSLSTQYASLLSCANKALVFALRHTNDWSGQLIKPRVAAKR